MVRITMEDGGIIDIELNEEVAPITCENFKKLVKEGFYNGLTFHEKQELSAKYQFGQLLLLTECSINIICFIITVQDVRFLHLSQQTLFPTA